MPPEAESRDPSEWFRKARQDLQQALEKSLKGFLIARGWSLRRTHNLSVLLDEAVTFVPALERHRTLCQEVSAFYVEERYPLSVQPPSRDELEPLFARAQQLIGSLCQ